MPGELIRDHVFVRDPKEGNQIYNRGYYGEPLSGGGLRLQLVESVFLVEEERLTVTCDGREMGIDALIEYANSLQPEFEINYMAYRDLRKRGYVVRSGPIGFKTYPRGGGPGKAPSTCWVRPLSERAGLQIATLLNQLKDAENTRKSLMVAIVDEEGDVTYYAIGGWGK